MGWTFDFIEAISSGTITPIYVIESVAIDGFRPLSGSLSVASVTSRVLPGATPGLSPDSSRVSYGTLTVGDWSSTYSEWEIGLYAGVDVRPFTTRGQAVVLRIGIPGWSLDRFQDVAVGQVQAIDRRGDQWVIRVRSLIAGLVARYTETGGEVELFHTLAETTLSGAYAVADPTLSLTSSTGAERDTGGSWLVEVTPDTGDPFFLTASGLAAPNLTGISAAGVIGTTAAAASSGNTVRICAYVQDHPLEVVRKVITSTGAGTNGSFDTLPDSWGLGVPDWLIDDQDCRDMVTAQCAPSGVATPVWDVYAVEAQPDAIAWISTILAPMGGFLAERQGRITIRVASTATSQPGIANLWRVDDSEIVSIDVYETWAGNQTIEYNSVRLRDAHQGTTTLTEDVETRPAQNRQVLDLPYVSSASGAERTAWREHIRDRVGAYYTRICETIEITTGGWRLAQACAGDHIAITSAHIRGRFGGDLDVGAGCEALIVSVEPDWFGSTVRLRCVILPQVATE